MKFHVTLILILSGPFLHSQHFTEAPQTPPFIDVGGYSAIAFADVDGNNTQDVLITGTSIEGFTAKLYLNDGNGNFTENTDAPFKGGYWGSVDFSDVDGNGTQDVLITGIIDTSGVYNQVVSNLYLNDGLGNFTEKMDPPFGGATMSAAAFADVDGNNTQDVMISRRALNPKLYLNDGNGNFTEKTSTPFPKMYFGSIAFADVDRNGTQDVLISGIDEDKPRYSHPDYYANLYLNDGNGNFTEKLDTPFEGVVASSIAFADLDGNNTQDVVITGRRAGDKRTSKLYLNDGNGNFTEKINTPFEPVSSGSIAFADVDGNHALDILITGRANNPDFTSKTISKLYLNDGKANFYELMDLPFIQVAQSSVAFADVDGNGTPDVLITGNTSTGHPSNRQTKLYLNNGNISLAKAIMESKKTLTVYPNPVIGQEIQISYPSSKEGYATIEIFDLRGRLLLRKTRLMGQGNQHFSLDLPQLPEGTYLLHLYDGENRWAEKFIVI